MIKGYWYKDVYGDSVFIIADKIQLIEKLSDSEIYTIYFKEDMYRKFRKDEIQKIILEGGS